VLTASDAVAAGHLGHQLAHLGYFGIALLVCIEGFGVPAPGQTAIIVAAAYAGTGHLNIVGVVAVALAAAIVGDNIGYYIGHHAGRRLVLRYGRYVWLTAERLERVEAFMLKRGTTVVAVSRFIEGLRQLSGIVCGTTGLPWRRFAAFDAIGAVAWVGVWSAVGYFAGSHLHEIHKMVRRNEWWAAIVVVLAAVAFFTFRWYRKRREPRL
jgi:membrane protein DedA with SNARE-associated domain